MHTPTDGSSPIRDDGCPDWDKIDFEVTCARCGYNLRMLTAPRCPECGLDFDWPDALDRSQNSSPFFEHQWRHRPVQSWFLTVVAAMRPRRFARSISIQTRIEPAGLWLLLLSAPLAQLILIWALAEAAGLAGGSASRPFIRNWWSPTTESGVYRFPSLSGILGMKPIDMLTTTWTRISVAPALPLVLKSCFVLAMLLVVFVLLSDTRMQCKVRSAQILRVIACMSVPIVTWRTLTTAMLIAAKDLGAPGLPAGTFRSPMGLTTEDTFVLFVCSWMILYACLKPQLADYLRIPSARSVAAVTCFVAAFAEFALNMRLIWK